MSIERRPYSGNWSSDFKNKYRKVVTWTPDAIVRLNGETSLAGCRECDNRIDFQSFITSVNVNGSLDDLSADISLTIPKHYGDSIFKDGAFLLQTGLEVHVYYRGFFTTDQLSEKGDTFKESSTQEEFRLDEVEARPYYPVFHGVVTNVSYSYSGGFYTSSLSCKSMLHFWESQQINTNAAYMAAKPTESRGSVHLSGHSYTGMTPHQIIYDLYRDTGGHAEGTSWSYSSKSNLRSKSSGGGEFYSLAMRYWERRFSEGMYDLRMYGASGRIYSATEQAYLTNRYRGSRLAKEITSLVKQLSTHNPSQNAKTSKVMSRAEAVGAVKRAKAGVLRQNPSVQFMAQASSKDTLGVLATGLQAFIPDLGALGNIDLFNSSYSSKKEIASQVAERVGYEFYQDFDGDLVFKPPFYNLDTASSRVYRIHREDIIDISYTHDEPTATYAICKGSAFRNQAGTGMENEFAPKGVYVDYRLVAKYGWKALEFDSSFYSSAEQAYYASVVKLDTENRNVNTASVTIPLRPEIKMGYPVYIEHIDTYYYVTSVNHSFSFGGACTTSLELTARRKKFVSSGNPNKTFEEDLRAVDFERTFLPPKPLYIREADSSILAAAGEGGDDLKMVGFPNVVMALDTKQMNPAFLYFPTEYRLGSNESERDSFRRMLVKEGYRLKVLRLKTPVDGRDAPSLTDFTELEDKYLKGPWLVTVSTNSDGSVNEIEVALDKAGRFNGEAALVSATDSLSKSRTKAAKLASKGKFSESKAKREQAKQRYDEALERLKTKEGGQLSIVDLIEIMRYAASKSGEGIPKAGSTQAILGLLSEKKASFNPNQPGYYRYYSSSHPYPDFQAPDAISVTDQGELKLEQVALRPDATSNNLVEPVKGDIVRFVDRPAQRGFRCKTFYDKTLNPKPTKDIVALSFVTHTVKHPYKTRGLEIDKDATWSSVVRGYKAGLLRVLEAEFRKFKGSPTGIQLASKVTNPRGKRKGQKLKAFEVSTLRDANGNILGGGEVKQENLRDIANQTTAYVIYEAQQDYPKLTDAAATPEERQAALTDVVSDIVALYKSRSVIVSSSVRLGKPRTGYKSVSFQTPIFPVSDERGYEVFGAYQYGRGLDILPRGTFDQLYQTDPTRIFTDEELDAFMLDLYRTSAQKAKARVAQKAVSRILDENGIVEGNVEGVSKIASSLGLKDVTNADQFAAQLANAIANNQDQQIATNTPVRLSRIRPSSGRDAMCDCRGHDDDIVASYLQQGQFVSAGEDLESKLVTDYRDQIVGKAEAWKAHQDTLKGDIEALPPRPIDLVNPTGVEGVNFFQEGGVEEAFQGTVGQASEDLSEATQNLKEAYSESYGKVFKK